MRRILFPIVEPKTMPQRGASEAFANQYNRVGVCSRDQWEYQHICNRCKAQHPGRDCSIVNTKWPLIPRVMDLVRHLTLLTLRFNFCIRTEHIEGKRNDLADSISRLQMDRFRALAPHANREPCLVLPELLKI